LPGELAGAIDDAILM